MHLDPARGVLTSPPVPNGGPATGLLSDFIGRIAQGFFGAKPQPAAQLSSQVPLSPKDSLYQFHEGDVFTPGAQNYAFDAFQELPLETVWGHGFLRRPNSFRPVPETPIAFIPPGTAYVRINGVGGLIPGQMATQPLESTGD